MMFVSSSARTMIRLRRCVGSVRRRAALSCVAAPSSARWGHTVRPVPVFLLPRRGLSAPVDPPPSDANAVESTTAAAEIAAPTSSGDVVSEDDDGASAIAPAANTVRLYPVYSRYDVEDLLQNEDMAHGHAETYARDAAVALRAPLDVAEIHRLCRDAFGTVQDLQYHNGRTWAPLLVADDVERLRQSLEEHPRGLERIVPIQVPQYFDEFGQSAAGPNEELEDEEEEAPVELPPADDSVRVDRGLKQMAQMIEEMLVQLHSPDSPWEIMDDKEDPPQQRLRWTVDPSVTLSTREWIIGLAEHEPEPDPKQQRKGVLTLRQLIYQYPGALDHMANSLHMLDALPPLPQETDEEGEEEHTEAAPSAGAKQDAV
jgi:hypothetical protein